jgi:hypothetical protein
MNAYAIAGSTFYYLDGIDPGVLDERTRNLTKTEVACHHELDRCLLKIIIRKNRVTALSLTPYPADASRRLGAYHVLIEKLAHHQATQGPSSSGLVFSCSRS